MASIIKILEEDKMILNIYVPKKRETTVVKLKKEANKRDWSLSRYIMWLLEPNSHKTKE